MKIPESLPIKRISMTRHKQSLTVKVTYDRIIPFKNHDKTINE